MVAEIEYGRRPETVRSWAGLIDQNRFMLETPENVAEPIQR